MRTQPQDGQSSSVLNLMAIKQCFLPGSLPGFFCLASFALENEVKGGFSLVAVQTWAVLWCYPSVPDFESHCSSRSHPVPKDLLFSPFGLSFHPGQAALPTSTGWKQILFSLHQRCFLASCCKDVPFLVLLEKPLAGDSHPEGDRNLCPGSVHGQAQPRGCSSSQG